MLRGGRKETTVLTGLSYAEMTGARIVALEEARVGPCCAAEHLLSQHADSERVLILGIKITRPLFINDGIQRTHRHQWIHLQLTQKLWGEKRLHEKQDSFHHHRLLLDMVRTVALTPSAFLQRFLTRPQVYQGYPINSTENHA